MTPNDPSTSPPPPPNDARVPAQCVIAAMVWLALAVYLQFLVPRQLDLDGQVDKPEQLRTVLPVALQIAVFMRSNFITPALAMVGLLGCGLAYIRRSALLSNLMIVLGIALLVGAIWLVLSSLPAPASQSACPAAPSGLECLLQQGRGESFGYRCPFNESVHHWAGDPEHGRA